MVKKSMAVVFVLAVVFVALMVFDAATVAGCNGGKCTDPLPTQSSGCDHPGGGQGPVHKCTPQPSPTAEAQPSPTAEEQVIPQPSPTAEAQPSPQPSPTVEEQVIPKPSPTAEEQVIPQPSPTVEAPPSKEAEQPSPEVVQPSPVAEIQPGPTPIVCDEECDPCALLLQALTQGATIIITNSDGITTLDKGGLLVAN
jgi:outer membrane biosynthesis protein TonB